MDQRDLQVLNLYINSLEEGMESLEKMYIEKNAEGVKKVKKFILEVQRRIDQILSKN